MVGINVNDVRDMSAKHDSGYRGRSAIHAKFIVRITICTDYIGDYNSYKTRKTKDIQAYGL